MFGSPSNLHRLCFAVTLAMLAVRVIVPSAADAQRYALFRGPALEDSLRANRMRFEDAWNDLLSAEITASAAGADSALALRSLEQRVADAEQTVAATSIASTVLRLRQRWSPMDALDRANAWADEQAGWNLRNQASSAKAESLLSASMTVYARVGDLRRLAWAAGRLGGIPLSHREFTRAAPLERQALALRRAHGDSTMVANTLNDLGGVELNLGHYLEAIALLTEARDIRERLSDVRLVGTLDYLASAYSLSGMTDLATATFRACLAMPATGPATIDRLINYADALRRAGRLRAAEDTLQLAASLAEEAQLDTKRDEIVERASVIAIDGGRFAEAIDMRRQLVNRAEAAGDSMMLAHAVAGEGNAWLAAQVAAPARRALVRAEKLATAILDSALLARCEMDLAYVEDLEGNHPLARIRANTANTIAQALGDASLLRDTAALMGGIAYDEKRLDDALRYHRLALSHCGDPNGEGGLGTRLNIAAALVVQGDFDTAEADLLEIAAAADSSHLLRIAPAAWANLAHIAWQRGQHMRALALSRENIARLETLRDLQRADDPLISLFSNHADEYDAIIQYLIRSDALYPDSGYATEAFEWSEHARARVLLDRRAGGRSQPTLSLREVQSRLLAHEALIAYSAGDSLGVAWVVRRDTVGWVELPSRHVFKLQVIKLRSLLQDPQSATSQTALDLSRSLGKQLLGSLQPWLKGATHLVLVPDGPLASLPFECLRVHGHYVIEEYLVSYAPSASVRFLPAAAATGNLIVALGDPAFGAGASTTRDAGAIPDARGAMALGRLPFSGLEVATLRTLAGRRPIVALTGRSATRIKLLAVPGLANASIIHLATHGVASNVAPERSMLWFAPDSSSQSPGHLSATDVSALDLHVDLITLAACESGLGYLARGEGVLGFTRAFLAAGAHSVVASLWKVSDSASARLMGEFYGRLLTQGASRSEALAKAKRALLASPATGSPFYWAPFVLVGEDGPLGSSR